MVLGLKLFFSPDLMILIFLPHMMIFCPFLRRMVLKMVAKPSFLTLKRSTSSLGLKLKFCLCDAPIPKKANVSFDVANLRPITLTLHIKKCVERVVLDHWTRQLLAFQDPFQACLQRGGGSRRCFTVHAAQYLWPS